MKVINYDIDRSLFDQFYQRPFIAEGVTDKQPANPDKKFVAPAPRIFRAGLLSPERIIDGGIRSMADIESLYKKEDGKVLIEIKLTSLIQLFNSFDPAPFYEKELDTDAEKYIVDTVKDFPRNTRFKIVVYLPKDLALSEQAETIGPAIHNHFQYLSLVADRKFRQKLRYGRASLLIGLSFLAIALIARQLVSHLSTLFLAQLFADALLIIGWVAMWEPITVMLYQLWPIVQTKGIYTRISTMEIEVIPAQK